MWTQFATQDDTWRRQFQEKAVVNPRTVPEQENPPKFPPHMRYTICGLSGSPIEKFLVLFKEISYWSRPGFFAFVGNAPKVSVCPVLCEQRRICRAYMQSCEMSQFGAWHSTTDRYVSWKPFQSHSSCLCETYPKAPPFVVSPEWRRRVCTCECQKRNTQLFCSSATPCFMPTWKPRCLVPETLHISSPSTTGLRSFALAWVTAVVSEWRIQWV